uniref:Protein kinase domain-containing protein n=1 Tax=Macrostomum lignano TaxID=282301 RepID=A0A1I8FCY2_9PLAT
MATPLTPSIFCWNSLLAAFMLAIMEADIANNRGKDQHTDKEVGRHEGVLQIEHRLYGSAGDSWQASSRRAGRPRRVAAEAQGFGDGEEKAGIPVDDHQDVQHQLQHPEQSESARTPPSRSPPLPSGLVRASHRPPAAERPRRRLPAPVWPSRPCRTFAKNCPLSRRRRHRQRRGCRLRRVGAGRAQLLRNRADLANLPRAVSTGCCGSVGSAKNEVLQIQAGLEGEAAELCWSRRTRRAPARVHQHPVSVQPPSADQRMQPTGRPRRRHISSAAAAAERVMTMRRAGRNYLEGGGRAAAATDRCPPPPHDGPNACIGRRCRAAAAASAVEVGDPNAMVGDESEDEPVLLPLPPLPARRAGACELAAPKRLLPPLTCFLPPALRRLVNDALEMCDACRQPVTERSCAALGSPNTACSAATPSCAASWTARPSTVDVHNRCSLSGRLPTGSKRAKCARLQAAHHAWPGADFEKPGRVLVEQPEL